MNQTNQFNLHFHHQSIHSFIDVVKNQKFYRHRVTTSRKVTPQKLEPLIPYDVSQTH